MIYKILIVSIIFFVVLEVSIFAYKYLHLPILPSIDQSERVLGAGPPLRYIAAGDSTAVGVGASKTENTYTFQIAQQLAQAHTVDYLNIGVKGYTSKNVLQKQVGLIINFNPDIVTISMGGNDATHLVASSELLANYEAIIHQLLQHTHATLYLTDVPQFNSVSLLPWLYVRLIEFRSRNQNAAILKLASDRVKIINIHDFGWAKFSDLHATTALDGFHPNDSGYKNWTAAFLEQINQ